MRLLEQFSIDTSLHEGDSIAPAVHGIDRIGIRKRHGHHSPTSFKEEELDEESKGAQCNFYNMQLGNNVGNWKGDKPGIQYAYSHDLKGQEVRYWWPGKAGKGECNNLGDDKKGGAGTRHACSMIRLAMRSLIASMLLRMMASRLTPSLAQHG